MPQRRPVFHAEPRFLGAKHLSHDLGAEILPADEVGPEIDVGRD